MRYFDTYTSASQAASGNQTYFINEEQKAVSRAFFKISADGKNNFSLLFSNILDSTFGDGSKSNCNMVLDEWRIFSMKVALCNTCNIDNMISDSNFVSEFIPLTFSGCASKIVAPGEFFSTDGFSLDVKAGQFLCVETVFGGSRIPCHAETLLPVFRKKGDEWVYDVNAPLPCMIGCDRTIKKKIAFLGDSITQGCGTPKNEYLNYAALVAGHFETEYACWNIGLGYGRGYDAATDGAWLFKAKQNDVITVCFGVNDILQGYSSADIMKNLDKIVTKLKEARLTVVLQTVPPFDYDDENCKKWNEVNTYIRETLRFKADYLFETPEFLSDKDIPQKTLFGPHPNVEGNRIWAQRLVPILESILNGKN